MGHDVLFTDVSTLADATHNFSDADMGQPFHWRKHNEGVRLGLIGTPHELQDLAARLLLEFGADPHQPDANGQTALQLAQAEGNEAVTAILGGQNES